MANQIILKKSSVASKIPVAGDLEYGELALNYSDGKLYYKKSDNSIDAFMAGASSGGGGTFTQVYPSAGIPISTGTAWGTSLLSPSSAIVGESDAQSLSNKTLDNPKLTSIASAVATATGNYLLYKSDGTVEKDFKMKSVYPSSVSFFGEETVGKDWSGYPQYGMNFQLATFYNGATAVGSMSNYGAIFAHNVYMSGLTSGNRVFAGGSGMISISSEGKLLFQTAVSGAESTAINWIDVMKSSAAGNVAFGAGAPDDSYKITVAGKIKLSTALEISQGGTGAVVASSALSNLGGQPLLQSGVNIKTINNTTLLDSGDISLQPTLVSGTNIKTINGVSILGSGDLAISGGGSYVPITTTSGAATLPAGTTAQRPASPSVGMIRYNTTLKVNEVYTESQITAGTYAWRAIPTGDTIIQASTNGEATYTTPGTYQWVCPAGVTAVSVVCVGGGAGAASDYNAGGGGGLAWCNNIPVTPGNSYTVVVGTGGTGGVGTSTGNSGGSSYFINASTVFAEGATSAVRSAGSVSSGGGYSVSSAYGSSGGGNGGGSGTTSSASYRAGGGGAGGYSGAGGTGGSGLSVAQAGSAGQGGGGGGGGNTSNSSYYSGAGGGVGLYGLGTSGAGGAGGTTASARGGGGSGGSGGGTQTTNGGMYGGGAGAPSGNGGDGAVRIIWGPNRAFPSTNTGVL